MIELPDGHSGYELSNDGDGDVWLVCLTCDVILGAWAAAELSDVLDVVSEHAREHHADLDALAGALGLTLWEW